MKGFRPLHDRLLVRRVEAEEKTPAGIIIPDTAKEKPVEGEALAVGPGARDETGRIMPLDVKVGDRVLFGKWAGTEVLIDGEEAHCQGIRRSRRGRRQDAGEGHASMRLERHISTKGTGSWLRKKSGSAPRRVKRCFAESILWPMR